LSAAQSMRRNQDRPDSAGGRSAVSGKSLKSHKSFRSIKSFRSTKSLRLRSCKWQIAWGCDQPVLPVHVLHALPPAILPQFMTHCQESTGSHLSMHC
jgi:hypothetical protein